MHPLASACLAVLLAIAPAALAAAPKKGGPPAPARPTRVVFQTEKGVFELEVDEAHAPVTARNFLAYVDSGFYDGGVIWRTVRADNQSSNPVKIEVIQAAINPARTPEERPAIALERTKDTGLKHLDGTVSMARDAPDSATSEFFICIGNQPALDYGGKRNPDGQGFSAFGKVVRGMNVVRALQKAPAKGQQLTPPIRIVRATRRR
jgi:peptidyl-prolyl cis-trans isomerase A (cyclophilin A)